MKRFTGTEKGGLVLASVIVIGGILMIARPIDMVILHPGGHGVYDSGGDPLLQHVSKRMAREIGGGTVLLGVAFASFVLCRSRD